MMGDPRLVVSTRPILEFDAFNRTTFANIRFNFITFFLSPWTDPCRSDGRGNVIDQFPYRSMRPLEVEQRTISTSWQVIKTSGL